MSGMMRAAELSLLARRFLVLAALMFWQGGFVFYASIVVPIGTEVLGGPTEQGFITRRVTNRLNVAGAMCLVPLAWDALVAADPCVWRRRLRLAVCVGMIAALGVLMWLHPRMDALLRETDYERTVLDRQTFRMMHRGYLWVSTVQWALAVGYGALTLWAWRRADRTVSDASQKRWQA
jgi:hypothetical protein